MLNMLLQDARTNARVWWEILRDKYKILHAYDVPTIVLNSRLKTTAGMCYEEDRRIELSTELLEQYTPQFFAVIIPHELAHQVVFDLYGPVHYGHGNEWGTVMRNLGLPPDEFHTMINYKHEARMLARHAKA